LSEDFFVVKNYTLAKKKVAYYAVYVLNLTVYEIVCGIWKAILYF